MLKSDFFYELPEHLIAQSPLSQRSASRLLRLEGETGQIADLKFTDLPSLLKPDDLLVFNDTRVIPARLYGQKRSGGRIEMLIERILDDRLALAHIKASKSPKPGSELILEDRFVCRVLERCEALFKVEFEQASVLELLHEVGHIPLPPYIDRADEPDDIARYQTVFAKRPGAVAAPTAGLHFDDEMFERLSAIDKVYLTLHVGSGTFQPLRVEDLDEHVMHAEYCEVDATAVDKIKACKQRGGRVIAVGTTAVRALETASRAGEIDVYAGDTRLFIRPGFNFNCVDAMITNFHLPESTLLTLVCAFSGYDETMRAYQHAVKSGYRFFSYGDALFLTRKENV